VRLVPTKRVIRGFGGKMAMLYYGLFGSFVWAAWMDKYSEDL
jgi:hypothetical protein